MQSIFRGVRLLKSSRVDRCSARLPNGEQQHLKDNAIKHAARKYSFQLREDGCIMHADEADAVPTDERPFKARGKVNTGRAEDRTDCRKIILALLFEGISL